jgi:hypothetical protein
LARAAQRWFGMPRVVTGFLNFATQPAVVGLLLTGIRWLVAAVPSFDSHDWKYGLEENLIAFLHVCWDREHHRIASDRPYKGPSSLRWPAHRTRRERGNSNASSIPPLAK